MFKLFGRVYYLLGIVLALLVFFILTLCGVAVNFWQFLSAGVTVSGFLLLVVALIRRTIYLYLVGEGLLSVGLPCFLAFFNVFDSAWLYVAFGIFLFLFCWLIFYFGKFSWLKPADNQKPGYKSYSDLKSKTVTTFDENGNIVTKKVSEEDK